MASMSNTTESQVTVPVESPLPMTRSIPHLISEVGTWATLQPWHPDRHAPDYGVVEEFGELTHAVLKNIQQIRGFEDPAYFAVKAKDAIGDVLVYLSHWCYLRGITFAVRETDYHSSDQYRPLAAAMMLHFNQMLVLPVDGNQAVAMTVANNIAQTMFRIGLLFGWDAIDDCLYPTWHKVKVRNWNKNRENGGEQAE